MEDTKDWRLTNQADYLTGVTLYKKRWVSLRQGWDHDHCEFCWATFSDTGDPDHLHEGYATADHYHWVCPACCSDFRQLFEWRILLVSHENQT